MNYTEAISLIVSEITRLADRRDRFLDVGRLLRRFYDDLPADVSKLELLARISEETGISTRTAINWMEIDRAYAPLCIPRERLASVGWAKLSMIVRYMRDDRRLQWLALAESHSVSELKLLVSGGKGPRRSLMLTFPLSDYALIVKALAAHGATPSSGGKQLLNKEKAIMRICEIALRNQHDARSPPGDSA